VQTGGALGELRGEGLLLQLAATVNPASVYDSFIHCVYRGDAALTASHAPGCPDAQMRGVPVVVNPAPGQKLSYGVFSAYLSAGSPVAQGYSFNNVGANEHLDFTTMWLTL
jgi:hypothetical protein